VNPLRTDGNQDLGLDRAEDSTSGISKDDADEKNITTKIISSFVNSSRKKKLKKFTGLV
jgi:hypothetical protein